MSTTIDTNAFFYGTLMHPKILQRVIMNDGAHLQSCPAVLLEYTRHRVKHAEYPGIVKYSDGKQLFDHELELEEKSVRGTLVTGLKRKDIAHLDVFEGDEYERIPVQVLPLAPFTQLSSHPADIASLIPSQPPPLPPATEFRDAINAETYIYNDINDLEAKLWSFEDFVRKNAWKWYGNDAFGDDAVEVEMNTAQSEQEVNIPEVERRREAMTTSLAA